MSVGKSTDGFRKLKRSLEPETMDLGMERTAEDRFFVCSVDAAPEVNEHSWRLEITGHAAGTTVSVGLDELRSLPQHRVDAWLECAGNGRRMFELVDGHAPSSALPDTQWTLGAMGMASWSGPRLSDVLALANPTDDLGWVGPRGLDVDNAEGEPVRMSVPIDKATHGDTIVALSMNDAPLSAAHGAPARLIVPGWVGAYSVKWLAGIELSSAWIPSWRNDEYYQHRLPDGTKLGPATAHPIKSCLALDWPAVLSPGPQEIMGYARVPGQPIATVEWSVDDGPWQQAELVGPNSDWSWSPFRFRWTALPGEHHIRTRATAADGSTQPETVAYNPSTILWNAIIPHEIHVR
jgi:DMSO/TMAO reductase YedYZ molybdopterin-dependent catalytic subunit